ncbi:MarR family winged helix-turn-helix transcriptional regulator [Streptomyces sp. NPDC056160]|uniref:MarR family winged helix-turn-helix transcriptional regulator n=1 Tax=Streptomyces sp. NPDC056160 TaxID=3345731 RepID=UPI0035D777ED
MSCWAGGSPTRCPPGTSRTPSSSPCSPWLPTSPCTADQGGERPAGRRGQARDEPEGEGFQQRPALGVPEGHDAPLPVAQADHRVRLDLAEPVRPPALVGVAASVDDGQVRPGEPDAEDVVRQFRALQEREGSLTSGEPATRTGLTTGATTRVIDRLERAGYARRVADPADRRRVIVEPVPEGLGRIEDVLAPPAASPRSWRATPPTSGPCSSTTSARRRPRSARPRRRSERARPSGAAGPADHAGAGPDSGRGLTPAVRGDPQADGVAGRAGNLGAAHPGSPGGPLVAWRHG